MEKLPPPPPPPSSSSSSKKLKEPTTTNSSRTSVTMVTAGFDSINDDLVQNILNRLPAASFASAACVNKSWNQICSRILYKPKFASALSLNPNPSSAVQEVLDKVLSEPIRPHFAIATFLDETFGRTAARYDLGQTFLLGLIKRLGPGTPIILTSANGVMGRDVLTDEFTEVMLTDAGGDGCSCVRNENKITNSGLLLTVGFLPGMKADIIKLKRPSNSAVIDKFVTDIQNYAALVSGFTSPVGIIMFGDSDADLKPVLEKLDCAMSKETIIVGDERTSFAFCKPMKPSRVKYDAVALVFAKERSNPLGIGEIQFHFALSDGVSAIGPRYRAVSVRASVSDRSTWLTARREGQQEILDGQRILDDINDVLENHIGNPELYIGVTRRVKCSAGSKFGKFTGSSLTFHGVTGGDEHYLFVDGCGINSGLSFQFYGSDPATASSACNTLSKGLRKLKQHHDFENCDQPSGVTSNVCMEFIGGFVFSCCGRGELFFGRPNVDVNPLLENFPGLPVAGIYCGGEIGRGVSNFSAPEGQEIGPTRCLHVYSAVYLLISYTPVSLGH